MAKIKIKKDQDLKKALNVACGECKRETKHAVLASIELSGQDDWSPEDSFYWDDSYQIIQCGGCETISFRKTQQNSEDVEPDIDGLRAIVREDLYPSRVEGRAPLDDHTLLPINLQRIYHETIKALNSSQPVLTGMGIRAVIETVCKDQKAKGSDLSKQIDGLVSQGVLTKEGADILHKLRILGNKAAHEVKPHDNVQLGLAIDVIDHLLLGVYILPHHAKKTFK